MMSRREGDLVRIPLHRYPFEMVLTSHNRLILGYRSRISTCLECRELDGTRVWRRRFWHFLPGASDDPVHYVFPSVHPARDGRTWTSDRMRLLEIGACGRVERRMRVDLSAGEYIGRFVLIENGFVVATYRIERQNLTPRLLRLDSDGRIVWQTALPPDTERKSEWIPFLYSRRSPLLVAGDLVVVSYAEMPASGVGVIHCLSLATGELYWSSRPACPIDAAIAGPDRVLAGFNGYGVLETNFYDRAGLVRSWPVCGRIVLDEKADVALLANASSNRPGVLLRIGNDGGLVRGDEIPGYYASHVVVRQDGRMIFWCGGMLYEADQRLKATQLCRAEGLVTRLIATDEGLIVFALSSLGGKASTDLCLFQSDLRSPKPS